MSLEAIDILFIGDEIAGYQITIYAERNNLNCIRLGSASSNILNAKNMIIKEAAKYVIINIDQVNNPEEEIIDTIISLKQSINSKVIIFAPGYTKEMSIISSMMANGINNFIFEVIQGRQMIEIENCFENKNPDINERVKEDIYLSREESRNQVLNKIEYPIPDENPLPEDFDINKKLIAVTGSMDRIGTTTVAIQFTKYLIQKGIKACYIERNNGAYTQNLKDMLLEPDHDEQLSKLYYNSVDMYYDATKINQVLQMDYDYYIYDYGNINNPDVDFTSILEKDIALFICGAKPLELKYTEDILNHLYEHTSPFYIFNFIHPNERDDIKALMSNQSERTLFLNHTPDPFTYNLENEDVFESVIYKNQPSSTSRAVNKKRLKFGR